MSKSIDYGELARAFAAGDVDAAAFSHLDHIGVAYEMLRGGDFLSATVKYAECIETIARRAGARRKFNTTITVAFMSLIAERMETGVHADFDAFMLDNADLLSPALLSKWYTPERLGSDLARKAFLIPDAAA